MVLDLSDSGKYYGFWAFLAWMFIITYRSGQILMNPLIIVFGWQLYEVDGEIDGESETTRVISKFAPARGKTYRKRLAKAPYKSGGFDGRMRLT
jgi:hypothetical protein